jgi:hypothetical protein
MKPMQCSSDRQDDQNIKNYPTNKPQFKNTQKNMIQPFPGIPINHAD